METFSSRLIFILSNSIAEGHQLIYDREFPAELRVQDSEMGPQVRYILIDTILY